MGIVNVAEYGLDIVSPKSFRWGVETARSDGVRGKPGLVWYHEQVKLWSTSSLLFDYAPQSDFQVE
jgi:hypothetical protein